MTRMNALHVGMDPKISQEAEFLHRMRIDAATCRYPKVLWLVGWGKTLHQGIPPRPRDSAATGIQEITSTAVRVSDT